MRYKVKNGALMISINIIIVSFLIFFLAILMKKLIVMVLEQMKGNDYESYLIYL